MTDEERIEKLAKELRTAAFPGARSWAFVAEDVRGRWIAAATLADCRCDKATDDAYRKATAALHANGEHQAVAVIRKLRNDQQ